LIVDEAQDLAGEDPLLCLNAWVRGGLAGGSWALFSDFTRQSIYQRHLLESGARANNNQLTPQPSVISSEGTTRDVENSKATIVQWFTDTLRGYAPHFTTLILRKNCRNTKPVGEETALLAGFSSLPYRLDDQDALPVDYRWWNNREDQAEKLRVLLASLTEDRVAPEQIMILSPYRFERSAASLLRGEAKTRVAPIEGMTGASSGARQSKAIGFSTIQAFKGMESPVVILCDIERISGGDAESLLYVGMSRARSHLVVFLNNDLRSDLRKVVSRRLQAGWR
jgi:superfamily I DNA/RNA helicase